MIKDIDLIVSLSNELFQLVQLRLVTKVTAIKAAIISWGPTRERNRWKQKKKTHYITYVTSWALYVTGTSSKGRYDKSGQEPMRGRQGRG